MNHHQIEKIATSMKIEIRNAAATNLNHSKYGTHASSSRHYCHVRIIERAAYVTPLAKVHGIQPKLHNQSH